MTLTPSSSSLLRDRRRVAVRRAEEGDVHAAEVRLAAEREVAAQPRQVLLHRVPGKRLGADGGELHRRVLEQQFRQQRAGVAAAADDAGAGDAGVAPRTGSVGAVGRRWSWVLAYRSQMSSGTPGARRWTRARREWSPAEGVRCVCESCLAGELEQTETPTGRRASCTSGSEGGAAREARGGGPGGRSWWRAALLIVARLYRTAAQHANGQADRCKLCTSATGPPGSDAGRQRYRRESTPYPQIHRPRNTSRNSGRATARVNAKATSALTSSHAT